MSRESPLGSRWVGYFEEVRSSCCKQHRRFCESVESYGKVVCAKIIGATQKRRGHPRVVLATHELLLRQKVGFSARVFRV